MVVSSPTSETTPKLRHFYTHSFLGHCRITRYGATKKKIKTIKMRPWMALGSSMTHTTMLNNLNILKAQLG